MACTRLREHPRDATPVYMYIFCIFVFPDYYILFDCPGQVELYTHHTSVRKIVEGIMKAMDFRVCDFRGASAVDV
jgi:hypothetical protein